MESAAAKKAWWEGDVFWKVIFRNLTEETQAFIQSDIEKRLTKSSASGAAHERERLKRIIETLDMPKFGPWSGTHEQADGWNGAIQRVLVHMDTKE